MNLFKKSQNNVPRRRLDVNSDNFDVKMSGGFKRNQTLSGYTPPSPRVKTHHLAVHRRKVFGVFMIILLSAISLWLLISNFTAQVTVNMHGIMSKQFDQSVYSKIIQEYLDINPIERIRFLLNQSTLSSFVVSKLPEVDNVKQQDMNEIGGTNFGVVMRAPVAGWLIDSKQHYVDANGVSFDKNYFDAPSVQIIDQSGATSQSGAAVVSQRFLGFVGRIVSQSKASGYTVIQAILPPNTTRELEIRLKEGDYLVKLSIDRSVGEQVEDMVLAIKHFTDIHQRPQYIDVRVSGKAFYKY